MWNEIRLRRRPSYGLRTSKAGFVGNLPVPPLPVFISFPYCAESPNSKKSQDSTCNSIDVSIKYGISAPAQAPSIHPAQKPSFTTISTTAYDDAPSSRAIPPCGSRVTNTVRRSGQTPTVFLRGLRYPRRSSADRESPTPSAKRTNPHRLLPCLQYSGDVMGGVNGTSWDIPGHPQTCASRNGGVDGAL
jgi:hypothetical protein